MQPNEWIAALEQPKAMLALTSLYSVEDSLAHAARYEGLAREYERRFGPGDMRFFRAPGRTELIGNHTDHNNGMALAAAVTADIVAVAAPRRDMRVTLFSRGYEKPFILDLGTLIPKPTERGTSFGIIRGIAAGLNHERKFRIGGFDAVCDSLVARGSGLSSSAAFEVLASVIFEGLYNERFLDPVERAKLAQNAENQYFGKACGLLDQLACSCGSMALYDFAVPKKPQITTIDFDFHAAGYSLMVVNTGDSHTMLTPHYNDIITEMQAVAKIFRANTLRRVEETAFYEKLPAIRERAGDRAALRAMHYFQENRRVEAAAKALQARNIQEYLKLINESGRSSENLLQNVYADAENQALALGLALSARILQGKGAWRVHGGGFAGTVQAYVPHSLLREYTDEMERVFGEGCCETLRVTNTGGREFVIRQ